LRPISICGNTRYIAIVSILLLTAIPADARSGTTHLLAQVRASLPKETAVPVRLPRWIPNWMPSSANFHLTAVMDAHRDSYQVTIELAGCGTGLNCQDVWIWGERLGRKSHKPDGIKVHLRRGLIGYYSPAQTGVGSSNSFAALDVDQKGFRYSIYAKQGSRAEIVHIALSAFDLPTRKSVRAPVHQKRRVAR